MWSWINVYLDDDISFQTGLWTALPRWWWRWRWLPSRRRYARWLRRRKRQQKVSTLLKVTRGVIGTISVQGVDWTIIFGVEVETKRWTEKLPKRRCCTELSRSPAISPEISWIYRRGYDSRGYEYPHGYSGGGYRGGGGGRDSRDSRDSYGGGGFGRDGRR